MIAISKPVVPRIVDKTLDVRRFHTVLGQAAPLLAPLGVLMGAAAITGAYAEAARGPSDDLSHFHLFWAGMLLFIVPIFLRLCAVRVARGERLALIAAVGLFDYLPKYLRSPSSPLYHDELAHWRQSEVMYATGRLFQPNPTIDILRSFPGLHALTVSLRVLSGLSTFDIGVVLPGLLHVIALIGIFVLTEQATLSARTAAFAALLYSLNPSFLFFDAEYAYESLGIVLCVWVIAAIVAMQRATDDRARQIAWFAGGLVLAAACVVTHHLSSYIAVAVSVCIAVVTLTRARRSSDGDGATVALTVAFAVIIAAIALAWALTVATAVWGYLTPYVTKGGGELAALWRLHGDARQLFALSVTPGYERLAAYAAPPIALLGAVAGLWLLYRQPPRLPAAHALMLFGLLYFPSVPFVLTQYGNEGARRSWAFTYIGLSLLVAPAISGVLDALAHRRVHARALARAGVAALLMTLFVGNVSAFTNETYRFPGPYVYGSDVRSLTPELLGLTRWFTATQGQDRRVVADRFSGLALASFGRQWPAAPSAGFPVWQLYFSTRRPSDLLLRELRTSDYRYMVVDRRMARYLPRIGVYFEPDEPEAFRRKTPPPLAALDRYDRLPWTIPVYQSDNLAVYRFDFASLDLPRRPGSVESPGSAGVSPVPSVRLPSAGTGETPALPVVPAGFSRTLSRRRARRPALHTSVGLNHSPTPHQLGSRS